MNKTRGALTGTVLSEEKICLSFSEEGECGLACRAAPSPLTYVPGTPAPSAVSRVFSSPRVATEPHGACLCDFGSAGSLARLRARWRSHAPASRKGKRRVRWLLVVYFLKGCRWKLGLEVEGDDTIKAPVSL